MQSKTYSIDCAKDLFFMGSCRSKWSLVVWFKLWHVRLWKKENVFYSQLVFWTSFSLTPSIHFYKYMMLLHHPSNFITCCQGRKAHSRLWVTLSVRKKESMGKWGVQSQIYRWLRSAWSHGPVLGCSTVILGLGEFQHIGVLLWTLARVLYGTQQPIQAKMLCNALIMRQLNPVSSRSVL